MYWPKFMEEVQTVSDWLKTVGCACTERHLMAIFSAMFCGSAAVNEILKQASLPVDAEEAPERVYEVIGRWQQCLPRDVFLLGEIYQRISQGRKARGVYYTPPEIIDFILRHTLAGHNVVNNPYARVIDPACGCGYFLLAAYDLLRKKYQEARDQLIQKHPGADWTDDGIHRHIITYNLWGADIDPVAIDIARVGLFLKSPGKSSVQPNLLVCDSLIHRDDESAIRENRLFWTGPYDFVIGNPPYLSFGLRGASRVEPEYADHLRRLYKETAEYKLSYYVLFMQRGLDLLADDGKLGFIVPDSFLLGRYFSKIRRYILENAAIETVAHITGSVFKQAAIGAAAVCILRKDQNIALRQAQTINVYQCRSALSLSNENPVCQLEQSYYFSTAHNRFRLFFDLTAKTLIDRIETQATPLAKFAAGHTGMRSLSKQSDLISSQCLGSGWKPGLISGRQVARFHVDYQGHWLNVDPAKLYKGGWQTEIIAQRKILLRQTGYTLIAAIDDQGLYHLNNIHAFTAYDPTISLDYLLLLLNSRLMSFYYHVTSMEYGRAMAQTDIETIELLPIRIHSEVTKEAAILSQGITDLMRRGQNGDSEASRKAYALDEYANQLIYRIYDLSAKDISYIEAYEGKRLSETGRQKH